MSATTDLMMFAPAVVGTSCSGYNVCYLADSATDMKGTFDEPTPFDAATMCAGFGESHKYACKSATEFKVGKEVCAGLKEDTIGYNDFKCSDVHIVSGQSELVVASCSWDGSKCAAVDDGRAYPTSNIEVGNFCYHRHHGFDKCMEDAECSWSAEEECLPRAYAFDAQACANQGWAYDATEELCRHREPREGEDYSGCAFLTFTDYNANCGRFVENTFVCQANAAGTACEVSDVSIGAGARAFLSFGLVGLFALLL